MKKKILSIALMFVSVLGSYAQEANIFGVKVGANIANMSWKAAGIDVSMDSKTGYYAAFTYERLIKSGLPLYFETGLGFASFGTKATLPVDNSETNFVKYSSTNHYMQVPVMLNYHCMVNDDFGFIPRLGFNFGVGLAGKEKISGLIGDMVLTDEQALENGDVFGDDGLKRFDIGLGVGLDFMYKRVTLGVMYDAGLMNISNVSTATIKNKAWTVALGYKF